MSKRKKRGAPKKFTRTARCRDCHAEREMGGGSFLRASQPRCLRCGGIMERVTPTALLVRGKDGILRDRRKSKDVGCQFPETGSIAAKFPLIDPSPKSS